MITEKNYVGNGINGLSLWYMVMPRGRERSDGEFEPAIMIERWIKGGKERASNRHQQKQGSCTPARCYPKDLDERPMGQENLVRKLINHYQFKNEPRDGNREHEPFENPR